MLEIYNDIDEEGGVVRAYESQCLAGMVKTTRDGDALLLGDIQVYNNQQKPLALQPLWRKLPFVPPLKVDYRGKGIGSKLLIETLEKAKSLGFRRIYGAVMQTDLDNNSSLLEWYQRFGFQVLGADEECISGAVNKVELHL